jgi:hypothetical protein
MKESRMRGTAARQRRRGPGGRAGGAFRGGPAAEGPFAAVAEALSDGGDGAVASAEVGRRAARSGVELGVALDRLRSTAAHAHGREPSYDAVRALCVAWADETLGLVNRVSCEEGLTGLATTAHLQARLGEAYRSGEAERLAVVVVDLVGPVGAPADPVSGAYRDVQVAERCRLAMGSALVACRACPDRLLLLVRRTPALGAEVGDLVTLVEGVAGVGQVRGWIEGLPRTREGAGALVDELSRR